MNRLLSWVRHACQAVPNFNPKAGMRAGSVIHSIDVAVSPFLANKQLAVAVQPCATTPVRFRLEEDLGS